MASPHELAVERKRHADGYVILEVDTDKAHLFGTNWKTLGDYGKRKFENLLYFQYAQERFKICYK